jgi:nucleoside-diphosphate-sugar epimerase
LCAERSTAIGGIVPVADTQDLSTEELILRIYACLNKSPRLFTISARALRLMLGIIGKSAYADRLAGTLHVDRSVASSVLCWHPKIDLESEIEAMVSHWLSERNSGP